MSRDEHPHLLDALNAIDPAMLDYQTWLDCGMALHESGYGWQDWDAWSRRDHERYHEGECERKWAGFGNGTDKVTSGTIIALAGRFGWRQPTAQSGDVQMFGWDDVGYVVAGPSASDAASIPIMDANDAATPWDPVQQLYDYVDTLFDDDECVSYVTDAWQRQGEDKWLPSKGHTKTAKQIKDELEGYRANGHEDAVGLTVGTWEEGAGAWIRFNPLDGDGIDNKNVTAYRYALVESDVIELDKQLHAIKDMHLPCAAVVSSAGKSVHAIVRVDAPNLEEYRKRVRWLYDYCDRHGFVTDKQNKNPSRLSRMPGVTRNGRRQLLLATNIGEESWDAWRKWAEESEDDLPDVAYNDWDEPIILKPMLIGLTEDDCILRQGAKMIVVGDSKMGKSYTLIDLAEAICSGGEWLGMQCAQGPVFYVNLEIDEQEFRWRQHKVWDDRPEGAVPELAAVISRHFVRWDMRGNSTTLDKLAPKLIRRVLSFGPPGTFQAIIIDPIYKVNGGDDNDAKAVGNFTNLIDHIIMRCGCSVIYAHHHPKGATGGRKAIDRMSGSGVYGRDADTAMDFSPLYVPDELWATYDHKPIFRAELTCRSFGGRKPIDCIFDWPRFRVDTTGKLKGCEVLGANPRTEGSHKGGKVKKTKTEEGWEKKVSALVDAFENYPHDLAPDLVEFNDDFVQSVRWSAFGLEPAKIDTVKKWIDGTIKGAESVRNVFEFANKNKSVLRYKKSND